MTFTQLQNDRDAALKTGDKLRKKVLTNMIDAIQKATIGPKGRIEITDSLVNEALVKCQKQAQEMVDTCPSTRPELLNEYNAELALIKEYAPQPLTDAEAIRALIQNHFQTNGLGYTRNNTRIAMTLAKDNFCDMKIVNQVWKELCDG